MFNLASNKRLFNAKLINMKQYTCKYCYKEFEPKRRRVQIYCSNTCRSKAHHAKKTNLDKPVLKEDYSSSTKPTLSKIESMSASGVANAAAGTIIASSLKNLLTSVENKPATKKDIAELKSLLLNRYILVKNLPKNIYGQLPYFDIKDQKIVYFNNL